MSVGTVWAPQDGDARELTDPQTESGRQVVPARQHAFTGCPAGAAVGHSRDHGGRNASFVLSREPTGVAGSEAKGVAPE